MLERLKALFRVEGRAPESEQRHPRDEAQLPGGPVTGATSPLDVGGDAPRAGGDARDADERP